MENKEAHLISLLSTDIYAAASGLAMGLQGEVEEMSLISAIAAGAVKWGVKAHYKAIEENQLVFSGAFNHTAYKDPTRQGALESVIGGGVYLGVISYCYLIGEAIQNFL